MAQASSDWPSTRAPVFASAVNVRHPPVSDLRAVSFPANPIAPHGASPLRAGSQHFPNARHPRTCSEDPCLHCEGGWSVERRGRGSVWSDNAAERGVLGTSPRMTAIGEDGRRSIPVVGATNPSPSNALQKKQRHRSSGLKPPAQSKLSLSRGRALGTGPSRRWGWNRAGPPGPGDRTAAGGGAQKAPRSFGDDGGTGGLTGLGVQTGLFQDQSESPTAPSGRL
jgi:hypothetical protein